MVVRVGLVLKVGLVLRLWLGRYLVGRGDGTPPIITRGTVLWLGWY